MKVHAFHGTLHLLDAGDRPLITSALQRDCEHRKYYMTRYYTPQEEQLFCNTVLDLLQQDICGHREIYTRLAAVRLDEKLCELACSNWNSLFVVLNIQGKVMFQHTASRGFTYTPISLQSDLGTCRKELIYRYLRGYDPVTLRDVCYFFDRKKKEPEAILQKIHNVQMSDCSGSAVYELPEEIDAYPRIPTAVFLGDFDPLVLGYKRYGNPLLPQHHLRKAFNLQGIVYPCFLYKGNVAGRQKPEEEILRLQSFEDFDVLQRQQVEKAAKRLLQPARIIRADF